MYDARLLDPSSRYVPLSDPRVLGRELVADSATSNIRPKPEKNPPDPACLLRGSGTVRRETLDALADAPNDSDDALLLFFRLRGRGSSESTLLGVLVLARSTTAGLRLSPNDVAVSYFSTGSDTKKAGVVRCEIRPTVSGCDVEGKHSQFI